MVYQIGSWVHLDTFAKDYMLIDAVERVQAAVVHPLDTPLGKPTWDGVKEKERHKKTLDPPAMSIRSPSF